MRGSKRGKDAKVSTVFYAKEKRPDCNLGIGTYTDRGSILCAHRNRRSPADEGAAAEALGHNLGCHFAVLALAVWRERQVIKDGGWYMLAQGIS